MVPLDHLARRVALVLMVLLELQALLEPRVHQALLELAEQLVSVLSVLGVERYSDKQLIGTAGTGCGSSSNSTTSTSSSTVTGAAARVQVAGGAAIVFAVGAWVLL